ncbi:hypothetical protein ACEQ8H_003746 [Pleosporales sp. CAS-2024a]
MTFEYDFSSSAEKYPDLIHGSDSDSLQSIGDEESTRKQDNNRLLAQAVEYLEEEGGDDSLATYMERVDSIDEMLVHQLPRHGLVCDPQLYRRVGALVAGVRRDFDNAAEYDSLGTESDDGDDDDALYQADSQSPSPTPAPTARPPFVKQHVERERHFAYGADTEPEYWYRDYPASLPFPETFMMEHWESIKMDFDLNRSKDAATAETIVRLDTPQMKRYFNLPLYESGSRFTLPKVSDEEREAVSRIGTVLRVREVANKFNEVDQTEGGINDYAPRLFLNKLEVREQWTPEQLRKAINESPLRSRAPPRPPVPSAARETPASSSRSSPAFRRISREVRQVEKGDTPDRPETFSTRPKATPAPTLSSSAPQRTPLVHGATSRTRPKPKSIAAPASTTRPAATQVAIPAKKPRGRPLLTSPKPVQAVARAVAMSSPSSPMPFKRKPSVGSQPYTTPKSSIKKVLRDNKTSKKSVGFAEAPVALEEDSEDPNYSASPCAQVFGALRRSDDRLLDDLHHNTAQYTAMLTSQANIAHQQLVTPPPTSTKQPLTPPLTDKKQSLGVQRVIALFKQIQAGTDTVQDGRIEFQLAEGEYDQIESLLHSDDALSGYVEDKIRYNYDGNKCKLAVRMPTAIHDCFIQAVRDDIYNQLKEIRNGSGKKAKFAQNVYVGGSTTIHFDTDTSSSKSRYDPDNSFWHEDAQYPGVIFEVGYSQQKKKLDRLADNYIVDSATAVQVVVCINLEYNNKKTKKATLSIWRPQLLDTPDGLELRSAEVVADKAFRDDEGNAVEHPGLRLRLSDFTYKELAQNELGDEDTDVYISGSQLCQYLDAVEARVKRVRGKPSNSKEIKKRPRSESPPEEIRASDEASYAKQEERAAKRADLDLDYEERSSTKSLSD